MKNKEKEQHHVTKIIGSLRLKFDSRINMMHNLEQTSEFINELVRMWNESYE